MTIADRMATQAEEVDSRYHLAAGMRRQINKVFPSHWSFMLGEVASTASSSCCSRVCI